MSEALTRLIVWRRIDKAHPLLIANCKLLIDIAVLERINVMLHNTDKLSAKLPAFCDAALILSEENRLYFTEFPAIRQSPLARKSGVRPAAPTRAGARATPPA